MALPTFVLGGFNLSDISGVAYGTSVMASGTSKGSPVPLEVAVKSWLQDGSIVVTQGYDNRTVTVRVKLRAPTTTALATAEVALFAELGKPNTLTWTPSSGPAAVFVVVTSSMGQVEDDTSDLAESKASYPWRHYDIRLTCEAFTRSATETVTAALPATGSTTTLLDACSATTGWTGFVDGGSVSPATVGGAITLTASVAKGAHTYALQKTFAATTTVTKLLAVRWKPPTGKRSSALTAIGDGVSLPLIAEIPFPTVAGYVTSYFQVAAASLAVTRIEWTGYADEAGSAVLSIDNVDVTNVNPISGTGRQQYRSLVVGGSARTPATLVLESSTAALGDAIVYVYDSDDSTNGYVPSMRQFRTAGQTVTADAARISGSREPLVGSVDFAVPVGLFPQGSYHLLGHMSTSSSVTVPVTVTTKTTLGGTPIGSSQVMVNCAMTTTWSTFVLAKFDLPTVDLPFGSPAMMALTVAATATGTPTYDELWLLNVDLGCYVRVNCGTGAGAVGGSARRLFITPPTIATPRPTIRIGHSADGSDAYFPVGGVTSWGFPEFKPRQVNMLAITPNATDAALRMANFNRWHTNPAA